MNREEFMKELEYLLQDIPEEDKADALDYYRDYLEEAGEEAEAAIQEFGSPERIAAIIRTDIAGHLENGGEFTERGYEDERFRDPNYQVAKRYDLPEAGAQPENQNNRADRADGKADYRRRENERKQNSSSNTVLKIVLIVILLVMTSPVWLGLGTGLLGILVGIVVTAVALLAAAAIVTIVFFIAGIAAGVAGVVHMAASPLGGLLSIGIGLLLIAISLVCLVVSVQVYGRFFPWLFRGTMDLFNGLFHRKER